METGALLCVDFGSNSFQIIQIIIKLSIKIIIKLSINDNTIFALKCATIYTIYCMNSGLSDAPCNNFQILFAFRQICLVQKQTMSKKF